MSLKLLNDPILRKRCEPIDIGLYPIQNLLDQMHKVMEEEKGIGLAANQVGFSARVFILRDGDSYKEYINPEFTAQSEEVEFEDEGCLSIPGASAKTKRFRVVEMTWLDKLGNKHADTFTDMQAFATQHEMDHLDGKLYIDQFGPMKRDIIVRKHNKFIKNHRR